MRPIQSQNHRVAVVVFFSSLGLNGCHSEAVTPTAPPAPPAQAAPPAPPVAPTPPQATPPEAHPHTDTARVRIMAANITSGNQQSYDPGEGIRIFQGLKPDVVLIQEFNYGSGSDADLRAFVERAFGPGFSYKREPAGHHIPNGVISRYPILDGGVWNDPDTPDRDLVWARLDVPGPKDLWAVSAHLLTKSAPVRNREAAFLVRSIRAQVPEPDYLVIGGDFNTDSRDEPCLRTLAQVVVTSPAQAPYPLDNGNNGNTNAKRKKPYDWVLADSDLNGLRVPVVIKESTFAPGLVFDSRVYQPIADVEPVRPGDSGATNMQHMAVVKDFALPLQ